MQHIPLVDGQKVGRHQREGNKEKPKEEQQVVNDQLTGTLVLMTGDADDWLMTGDANFQETRSSIKKKENVEFRMAFQLPSFNVVHHYKD